MAKASHPSTTTFIVTNLHCPSCVGNIEAAVSDLNPKPRLISSSIVHHTLIFEHLQPAAVIEALLDDQGYEVDSTISSAGDRDATAHTPPAGPEPGAIPVADRIAKHRENCTQCREEAERSPAPTCPPFVVEERPGGPGRYRYALSIEGMTCASCVGAITKVLDGVPWVVVANVNLLSGSASVMTEGEARADELVEMIEDLGYDARVEGVDKVKGDSDASDGESGARGGAGSRTVELFVNGIYCHHCPLRIEETLLALPDHDLKIVSLPSIKQPILKLSYMPDAPDFTIRHIIDSVASVDEAFDPCVYHPPTVEERADKMHRKERRRLALRLLVAGILAVPTFVIAIVYMDLLSSDNPGRILLMSTLSNVPRGEWALFILATPVYFGCADVFHRRAIKELKTLWRPRSRTPLLRRFYRFGSMSMLLSFGTTIAYFASVAEVAIAATHTSTSGDDIVDFTYFDSVIFLTFFLLIGRLIEAYSKSKSGNAVAALGKLRPQETKLITKEGDRSVRTELLDVGDRVRVPHGASPPCDGTLVSKHAIMDESSLTGESAPVKKEEGDMLYSGTVNQGDAVVIRVTGVTGSSMLDQIIAAVRDGQTKRAPVERIVDSLTAYFVPAVTLFAVLDWIIWLALGQGGALPASWKDDTTSGWPYWSLQFAIAVFVIACPCGIGLAAPTALLVGGGLAAKHGILVKGGGEAFQEASRLDCIVFDKTGTLTQGGQPQVTDFEMVSTDTSREAVLPLILAVENTSSHPIAKALVQFCVEDGASAADLDESKELSGRGMLGVGSEHSILIGNERLMTENGMTLTADQTALLHTWSSEAKSVVLIATRPTATESAPYTLAAALSISDPIRPEAAEVIAALHRMSIATYLLTGDNATTAAAVGRALSIPASNIIASVLPHEKASKIKSLQSTLSPSHGRPRATVAMVGDGVNDAPALATADVGVAVSAQAADVAIAAAGFVLVRADLRRVPALLRLSRAVFARIRFNFAWALAYNVVALPVAAGVLFPVATAGGGHVRLAPAWAALAMAASSVSVVGSSLALRSGVPGVGFRG